MHVYQELSLFPMLKLDNRENLNRRRDQTEEVERKLSSYQDIFIAYFTIFD